MKNEKLRPWVDALRGGGYEQGRAQLRAGRGYCCLGVLCDVSGLGAWEGETYVCPDGDRSVSYPSPKLLGHFGLGKEDARTLPGFNDYLDGSFVSIAGWVEDNL